MVKFSWKSLIGDVLLAGETFAPVFIHIAKSQQQYLVITTDVNALYQELFGGQASPIPPQPNQ